MRRRVVPITVFLLALLAADAAQAGVIFVSPTGSNNPQCGSVVDSACATLSYAASLRAQDRDTVSILPGLYKDSSVRLINKAVNFIAQAGAQTVIDCGIGGPLFYFEGSGASEAQISNLKVTNCSDNDGGAIQLVMGALVSMENVSIATANAFRGGAILVDSGSSLSAKSLTITDTKASFYGGAILVRDRSAMTWNGGSVTMSNCVRGGAVAVTNNSKFSAVGLWVSATTNFGVLGGQGGFLWAANDSLASISRSTVMSCKGYSGGAFAAVDGGNIMIEESKIMSNAATDGGGAAWVSGSTSSLMITSSIVSENSASIGGGGAIKAILGATVNVTATLFTRNKIDSKDLKVPFSPVAGILVTNSSKLMLHNCTLASHEMYYAAMGVALTALGNVSTPESGPFVSLSSVLFKDNSVGNVYSSASAGCTASFIGASSVQITATIFDTNKCGYQATGTIGVQDTLETTISGSSFIGNRGDSGAAAGYFAGSGRTTITNSTLLNNIGGSRGVVGFSFKSSARNDTIISVSGLIVRGNRCFTDCYGSMSVSVGTGTADIKFTNISVSQNPAGGMSLTADRSSRLPRSIMLIDSVFSENRGGALSITGAGSIVRLKNTAFYSNSASSAGAVYIEGYSDNSPSFDSCTFFNNSATKDGGAIVIKGNSDGTYGLTSSPVFKSCTFIRNSVLGNGGALVAIQAASPQLRDCHFEGNTALNGFGGAVFATSAAQPRIEGSILVGNSALYGGAIGVSAQTPTWPPLTSDSTSFNISKCKLANNVAARSGGALYIGSLWGGKANRKAPELRDVLLEGNVALGSTRPDRFTGARDGGGAIFCNGLWTSAAFIGIRLHNNSAPNNPWTHQYAARGCGQLNPFVCEQCVASDADCLLSGNKYGGSCHCTSQQANSKFCTNPSDPLVCFGVSARSGLACSGRGQCILPDQCLCDIDRSGLACENSRMELVVKSSGQSSPNCTSAGVCPSIDSALWFIKNSTTPNQNGYLISLPKGEYTQSGIALPLNTNLRGLGAGAVVISQRINYSPVVSVSDPSFWTTWTIVERLTLMNGTVGAQCDSGSLLIRDAVIKENLPAPINGAYGGGVVANGGRVWIKACSILKNSWVGVGGISQTSGDLLVEDTEVAYNFAAWRNGFPTGLGLGVTGSCAKGLETCFQSRTRVINCRFHHQSSGPAIGMDSGSFLSIVNTTVDNNPSGIAVGISYSGSPTYPSIHIKGSKIVSNDGAGVSAYVSRALIEESLIENNRGPGVVVRRSDSLTLKNLHIRNNTSTMDGAAGLYLDGLSGQVTVEEIDNLFISLNNGTSTGGIGCIGPKIAARSIQNVFLSNNYCSSRSYSSPNEYAWNQCFIFPLSNNCSACAQSGSRCILSSKACVCQPGYSGPNCL